MCSLLVHVYEVFLSLYICIYLKMIYFCSSSAMIEWSLASLNIDIELSTYVRVWMCVRLLLSDFVSSSSSFSSFLLFAQTRVSSLFSSLRSFGGSDDDHHQWLIVKFVVCVLFLLPLLLLLRLLFFIVLFHIQSKTARNAPVWIFEYMLMVLRASSVI